MAAIAAQRIPNPKTFYSAATPEFMNPAYLTEDYSPITEEAQSITNAMKTFGTRYGSQGLMANLSKIQGTAAREAANHALQVKNANVDTFNKAEMFNTEVANTNNQWNQVQKAQNFDAQEAYKAQRILAQNKKLADFTNAAINRENNAIKAYNMNITSPYYKIDPNNGGLVSFYNGKAMKANADAMQSDIEKTYKIFKDLGYSHDQILDVLKSKMIKQSVPQTNDLMPDYTQMTYPFQ
jgi:hypothetical protein